MSSPSHTGASASQNPLLFKRTAGISTLPDSQSPLFIPSPLYKPLRYPWAYESWLQQQQLHWLAEEVPMNDDIRDWNHVLTDEERHFLTQIFRFFTQMDVGVGNAYLDFFVPIFGPHEIRMMLVAFAHMETTHQQAYSYLLDSLGMPETEYEAFFQYREMREKWDYMGEFSNHNLLDVTKSLAFFSAFTEGLQLFASFAMLMNFPRFNKMKGMGQIVSWSIRDETLHMQSMIRLFRLIIAEHPWIWTPDLQESIVEVCRHVVEQEDAFIELAFQLGGIENLSPGLIQDYTRYIANRRLKQLGLPMLYDVHENPLPWMDVQDELTNFFENRVTEYTKSATSGDWVHVF